MKSPETLAAEAEAGAFDDYYARILLLAQTHSAEPDSFRAAVAALPGSRLDEESWEAWVRPWVDDPRRFTDRLESMLADMKPRPSPARGADSTRVPGAPPPP